MSYLFTSESVSEGHPDKVADQISDALLDEFLRWDPESKVACETLCTTGLVICSGEIRTEGYVISRKLLGKLFAKLVTQNQIIDLTQNLVELSLQYMNSLLIYVKAWLNKTRRTRALAIKV